jgi:hypothetical protein
MKNEIVSSIENTNIAGGKEFRVLIGPEIFKIFSSQIYSNKIRAVIRELSTNAKDAHIEAGIPDKPFKVKLPSYYQSEFYIRDYGLGMSKEKIENLYSTYGESDKTKSNDTTGCFGLGSKSPFCYVDSFIIESYQKGKKYRYIVFFNERNIPKLSDCDEMDTDEPDGFKVSFSTKSLDETSFRREAEEVYSWFDVKPDIESGCPLTFKVHDYLIREPDYGILKDSYYNESKLIMGGVAYSLSDFVVCGKKVHVFANIGDVGVTVSRETLDKDDKTIKFLEDKQQEIEARIRKYIEDKISNAPSYWEACREYNLLNIKTGGKKPQYNGVDLVTEFHFAKDEVEIEEYYIGSRNSLKIRTTSYLRPGTTNISSFYNKDTYVKNRIKHYIESQNCLFHTIKFKDDATKKDFETKTGLDTSVFPLTSSLPKPPKGSNCSGYKGKIFKYKPSLGWKLHHKWEEVNYDGEEGYYVLSNGIDLEDLRLNEFDRAVELKKYYKDDKPIFRITKTNRNKLLKQLEDEVTPLKDVLKEYQEKFDKEETDLVECFNAQDWLNQQNAEFLCSVYPPF